MIARVVVVVLISGASDRDGAEDGLVSVDRALCGCDGCERVAVCESGEGLLCRCYEALEGTWKPKQISA